MEVSKLSQEIENELRKVTSNSNASRTENSSQKSGQQAQPNRPNNNDSNARSTKSGSQSENRGGEQSNASSSHNQSGGKRDISGKNAQAEGMSGQKTMSGMPPHNSALKPPQQQQQYYTSYYQQRPTQQQSIAASPNPSLNFANQFSPYPGTMRTQQALNHPSNGQRNPNQQYPQHLTQYSQSQGLIHRPQAVGGAMPIDSNYKYGQGQMMMAQPSPMQPPGFGALSTQKMTPGQQVQYRSQTAPQTTEERQPQPILQNIVSTANLGCKLDLRRIALNCRNAEYNPRRFAAVIMRIRDPKTTALIFTSGKMVCTGAKSEELSRDAAKKYSKAIKKVGFQVQLQDFKIQNIVGSCDVQFAISLEGLSLDHDKFSTYEAEIFPGLIYRMVEPKIVLLIFASGKIVLTGAKNKEDIFKAFEMMYFVLKKYKKKQLPRSTNQ